MSTIEIRLPKSLHESLIKLAEKEEISVERLVNLAIAEKISAWMTSDILAKRAARADKKNFLAALAKVADVEPAEDDRIE